ncbi:MAG: hypothetical protein FJX74_08335 [Armatimonadetes bacterium]|nr:hypothetical protein [Armatimonadota bacterium]
MRRVRGRAILAVVCAGVWAGAARHGPAQSEVYCTLVSTTVDKLSNATRVTLTTDGLVTGDYDAANFVRREGNESVPRRLKIIPFRLTNARTRLGSFVDVGQYPISHVSFSVPKDSREGVGLDVSVVLYRRSFVELVWLGRNAFFGTDEAPYVRIRVSDDRRSVIITARSDRYREPEASEKTAAPSPKSRRLEVTRAGAGRLNVLAVNAELGAVLSEVASQAGAQIAVRGGASYRASMSVKNVSLDGLLRAVGRAYGLSVKSVGGIYYVTDGLPGEVDSYWAAPTASFQLQHLQAEQALDLLPEFLLPYVHVDQEKNRLVATGPPQLLDKLEADLRVIDRPVAQIKVSGVVVEELTGGGLDLASEVIYATGSTETRLDAEAGQLGFGVVDGRLADVRANLRGLVRRGRIRTRVCPSVVVASGEEAHLFLGQRRHFAFQRSTLEWGHWPPTVRQEVVLESTEVGSRIWTRPWSSDGETITLETFIEANTVLTVSDEGLPRVASRNAYGVRRITSGDTVAFGGLTLDTPSRSRRQIGPDDWPLLSDLGGGRTRDYTTTRTLVLLSARASLDASDLAAPGPSRAEGTME